MAKRKKAAGRAAGRAAGKKGWSASSIAPILGAGIVLCGAAAIIALRRASHTGPQPERNQSAGDWTKGFFLTPPVTPRPGARGLYENIELPVEKTPVIDCSQIPKPDPAKGFYPERPAPGSPWEICWQ